MLSGHEFKVGDFLTREKNGRGDGDVYTISNVCFYFHLERKTQKTKDVYIYDCYNFNWYILLNGKHDDRVPPMAHAITHSQT